MKRPFGAGFNGHARKCECLKCIRAKVDSYMDRINDDSRTIPESLDRTVPVRAHWRRAASHLSGQPKLKAALRDQLRKLRGL